ncbi:MAG: nucleotidyltransferase family protein [Gaiellaceae bacterium]
MHEPTAIPTTRGEGTRSQSAVWEHALDLVRAAVDRSQPAYGLELLGEQIRRERGVPAVPGLEYAQQLTTIRVLVAEDLLRRVRAAYDGQIVLIKGLEVALRYPDPGLRPFGDLDLLVPDTGAAQRALLDAGFEEVMDPDLFLDIHQERPLALPGSPLMIELHKWPKWPDFLDPPPLEGLLAVAVDSRSGVAGIQALPDAQHAVVVAAHAWTHGPLNHPRQLLDVAVLAEGIPRAKLRRLAAQWDLDRIWETTIRCADSLFGDAPHTAAERLWARHLRAVRERTVAEAHLEKYLSPLWAYSLPMAVQVSASMLRAELRPAQDETWREKGRRTLVALRNSATPRSRHDEALGPEAEKRRKPGRFTRTG